MSKAWNSLLVLFINVLYVSLLFNTFSEIHNIDGDIIQHYTKNISADTGSYLESGTLRTVGYGIVLRFFMMFDNWLPIILIFNCLLGAWMFYVVYDMIGRKAWILFGLGAFTAYVPMLYTDLLFATLFVTSIWLIKKNLWLHFLFLGLASVVRPSLAWFFLIEPIVLYTYGHNTRWCMLSLPIAFVVTSFNPIRNYVKYDTWTHSTVLKFNIESGEYYDGPAYFVKSFKANALSGHYDFIGAMYNKYKRDMGDKEASTLMWWANIIAVLLNALIWLRFGYRVVRGRVNWGNVVMVAYFIVPTLFGAAGARLRLPIEWMLI